MALYRFTECRWWLKSAILIQLASFAGWNLRAQYHFSSLCLWFRVAAEMISEVAAAEGREPILCSLGTAVLFWPCAKSFREPSWFSPGTAFCLFPKGKQTKRAGPWAEGVPGCSGYVGLAITQKSPTSFFSYQDLQIDQVTACSHF